MKTLQGPGLTVTRKIYLTLRILTFPIHVTLPSVLAVHVRVTPCTLGFGSGCEQVLCQ